MPVPERPTPGVGMTTTKSLGRTATRGAVVTMGGQGARIAIQLLGIVLLARLLSPADYGVTAMVLAIIGVGEILRDFGLSSAAIQAKTLTAGQRANLFWINLGIGAALTGVVAALAHPIAAFYDDERLVLVTLVLSSTFFLNGFSTQFRADLNRHFRFGALATIEVAAQAMALVSALALAALGWGYWALVALQVLQVFFQAIALPIMGGWWPGFPRRGEEMKPLLKFGGSLVGAQILNYASRNVDSIVIGREFGAQALGYYNRAFQLMVLPLNQINAPSTRVALPTLSRLQSQPERYAEFISFGQTVLLNIVGFVLGFSVAQATDIVAVALGPQWAPTVPLFQILAVAGFFQAAAFATYWVVPVARTHHALSLLYAVDPAVRHRTRDSRGDLGRPGCGVRLPRVHRPPVADRHPVPARAFDCTPAAPVPERTSDPVRVRPGGGRLLRVDGADARRISVPAHRGRARILRRGACAGRPDPASVPPRRALDLRRAALSRP